MDEGTTLYIGAHADDVIINASVTIRRNPVNAYILTVTDGAPPVTYPRASGGIRLDTHEAYVQQRLKEDMDAMHALGIDVGRRYRNAGIPDGLTHQNIEQIVRIIGTLVKREIIGRIVTHRFPGESHAAHPDHEIVSFCSHIVGRQYGIEVWEYRMFKTEGSGKETGPGRLEGSRLTTVRCDFTPEESAHRDELMKIYVTQGFIRDKYRTKSEIFSRIVRNPRIISDTTHLYGGAHYRPTPQDIRKAIVDFLSD